VGHVAIDRTTLNHLGICPGICPLLLQLCRNGEVISNLEIPNLKPVKVPRDENGEPVAKRAKRSEAGGVEKQTRNRRQGEDDAEQTRIFWAYARAYALVPFSSGDAIPQGSKRSEAASLLAHRRNLLFSTVDPPRTFCSEGRAEGPQKASECL
jgi:hypothetical protein